MELDFQEWEDNIYYRTISPRHFEAAAFRVCQILFEGRYSGIMEPMVHYLPLKKDFSNFDDVIRMFKNAALRKEVTDNAYDDLIASELYAYKRSVEESFDKVLLEAGLKPEMDKNEVQRLTDILNKDARYRQFRGAIKSPRHFQFPGRALLIPFLRPIVQKFGRRKGSKDPRILDNG